MANLELHVIFGTGPVGQAVARELVKRSKTAKMINRSGKRPGGVPDNVTVVAGDLFDMNVAGDLTKGAAVVYQCTNPPYDKLLELFPPLQANTLEAAANAGAKYIVTDNLYMYGDTNGQPIREDLPYNAHTKKGRVRAQMAEAVMAAHRSGKALVILGERDEVLGQVWHVPNAETLTTRQFVTLIYNELQQPAKMSAMGKTMLRMGSLFIPAAREMIEMMYEFEKPFVVDSSKFERAFGAQGTPVREAIKTTVAWYQRNYRSG